MIHDSAGADRYHEAAQRAADWLEGRIRADGSLGEDARDLAAYYKAPAAMHATGRVAAAHRLLDHVAARFQRASGHFASSDEHTTADPVLSQYPGYLDGWLTLAAQRLGRFDLSVPAWRFLRGFQHPERGASVLDGPWSEDGHSPLELLMTAHLGLTALYCGDVPAAVAAGEALIRFHDLQPEIDARLFLRMDPAGALIRSFPEPAAGLHVVEAGKPGQAWFFVGYPMAFLAHLHRATTQARFLRAAHAYGAFALRCGDRATGEHFGHKIGWGAALLARLGGGSEHRAMAHAVATHLLATQAADGGWLEGQPPVTRLDQTAEVICWLVDISALLR